jgi:hypothetical protein
MEKDMRFGTWKVKSVYRSGLITAAAREVVKYKLDLVGVEQVRWDQGGEGTRSGLYYFRMEEEKKIVNWEQDFVYTTE